MKTKHPIDNFFKENLENHKEIPSDSVWEKLDDELGEEKRKTIPWMQAAAVALLVGLGGAFFYQNLYINSEDFYQPRSLENRVVFENFDDETDANLYYFQNQKESENVQVLAAADKLGNGNPILKNKEEDRSGNGISKKESDLRLDVENASGFAFAEEAGEEIEILSRQPETTPRVSFTLKLKPVSPALYDKNDAVAETKDFKEKVFAYAGDQMDNLLSGKKLEAPKMEKKPRLEIDLDKIFN